MKEKKLKLTIKFVAAESGILNETLQDVYKESTLDVTKSSNIDEIKSALKVEVQNTYVEFLRKLEKQIASVQDKLDIELPLGD